MVESGRGFSVLTACLEVTDPVIVLTCPEPLGRVWLEERRAKKNRGVLSPFWTPARLDYECNGYLLNHAKKYLHPDQYKHFVITDREKDWGEIDDYFGVLYRRLHNELIRKGRK